MIIAPMLAILIENSNIMEYFSTLATLFSNCLFVTTSKPYKETKIRQIIKKVWSLLQFELKTLLDYWSYAYLEIVYLGHRRIRYPPANSQPSYCKTRWFRTVVQLSIWKGPQPSKQKKWSRIAFDRHEENQNGSTPSKYALGNLSKANPQNQPSTNPC